MSNLAPTWQEPEATDPVADFRDAITDSGLPAPDHIDPDGQLHRFSTNGKSGDKAGFYCLHLDGVAAGHFGCWREGIQQNWRARNGERLDSSEMARLRASMEEVKRQRGQYRAKRAEVAQQIWETAEPVESHLYLTKKGLPPVGDIRRAHIQKNVWLDDETAQGSLDDCLLIRIESPQGLQSLQAIKTDGFKSFMAGGSVSGGYTTISGSGDTLYLCEGWATGASIHIATGATVLIAFNAGNLSKVAKEMRGEAPSSSIVIAGDSDAHGRGQQAAEEAAQACGGTVALPEFADHQTGSDWNDFYALHGSEALKDALEGRKEAEEAALLSRLETWKAKNLLAFEPPPQRFLIDGMLPEPVAAGIVAPGSTGKSFWLMQLAACVATGTPFLGQGIPRPGAVLMLGAEDDRDEMSRRLHSVYEEYEWQGQCLDHELLGERFYPVSMIGEDNRLINDGERDEAKIAAIISMARAIPDLRLIILDPVSRFRAGEENSNDDNTRFAEVLEHIRQETDVTVLVAHHSRKGATGDTVDDMRGGSAFSDALRFVATLAKLTPDRAKSLGLAWDDAKSLVRYRVVKSNYRTDVDEQWMQRGVGGVLKLTDAPAEGPSQTELKGEERYRSLLPKLRELVGQKDEEGRPLTRSKLRRLYGGTSNSFGIGKDALEDIANRAIQEGKINLKEGTATLHLY